MGGKRVALITGSRGFAGPHLIHELTRATDWKLVGLSHRAQPAEAHIPMVLCDLLDSAATSRIVERLRPDIVFHLAAQTSVPESIKSPGATIANNVVGQINLFEAIRAIDLNPTILIVGSSEVYGHALERELPISEEQPFRPASPYAVSKIGQDMLGLQYHLAYEMKVIRVRPFNHCGPGQSHRFVLSDFARQVATAELGIGEPVIRTGELSAERDFLDVRDVVRAYRLAVEVGDPGEVYNIASGRSWRIGKLLEQLIALARVEVHVQQDPERLRPSDTPKVVGDASRFTEATGWQPLIPMDVSLADILDDWRAKLRSSHAVGP